MALSGEQWERIEALLPEALELASSERPRFLDRHCPPELRAEIEALIAAAETGYGVLDRPVTVTAPEDAAPSLAGGEALGPWRIGGLLGSGGMGEVYAAERADGSYEQRVAIKLLKRGIDTQAVLSRFLRERRILARLSHPNIARLFDAGAAADGRPYLVMERVDGLSIDVWCERKALSLRQKLELMCQVCEAIYAAHREQIVHRDLKPSNVLVTEAGEVKLLDFGVSKLVGEEGGEQTQTVLGIAPMTPDYAAPEQLLGQSVTAATDVYALGLLLYRLLTGELPHSRHSLVEAVTAAGREDRVTRPSLMLRKHAGRDVGTRRVQARELDGDMDQIVLKALQRDPGRRYASAADLADDLRRHLDGRPVLARPDSRWYVARKFIVRNWVPVSAIAAVVGALLVGITVALWQARVAEHRAAELRTVVEFQSAMVERVDVYKLSKAWTERMRSRIADKLQGDHPLDAVQAQAALETFDRLLPWSQPSEVARETLGDYLLAPASSEIKQRFAASPAIAGQLHSSLGLAYENIGLYKEAVAEFQDAITAQTSAAGFDGVDTLDSRLHLAAIELESHDSKAAAATAKSVVDTRTRILGLDDRGTLRARHIYTHTIAQQGDYAQALSLAKSDLALARQLFGPDDPDTLKAEAEVADDLYSLGQGSSAIPMTRHLLDVSRKRWGDENSSTLKAMNLLGIELSSSGDLTEARKLHEEALAIRRRTLGDDHPDTLQSLGNLAVVVTSTGPRSQAYRLTKEFYLANRRVLDESNRRRLSAANNYAQTLQDRGDFLGACRLEQRVLELRKQNFGAENPYALHSLEYLGALLAYQKQYSGSLSLLGKALEADRRVLGPDHPQTLETRFCLGESLLLSGDRVAALKELTALEEKQRNVLGVENENSLLTITDIGKAHRALGDLESSRAELESNLAVQKRTLGEISPDVLTTEAELAQTLHEMHRDAEAQKLEKSVLEVWQGQSDGPSKDVIDAQRELATIDDALGQGAESRGLRRDADAAEQQLMLSFAADQRETGISALAPTDDLCTGGKHPAAIQATTQATVH
jgi:serine/threonine-protein kinase